MWGQKHKHPPQKVITPRADTVDQEYSVQRSGRSVFLLQEEPQHLAAGVRPARVGVIRSPAEGVGRDSQRLGLRIG
jgi:hypothetical protein